MPRNGSGTYNLPSNSWFPAVNGVTATSTDWNTTAQDIQAALTQSVSSDGQTAMTGNLPMGNNKITGLANGTAATDAATFGQTTGRLIGVQRFTASGPYTPTTGTTSIVVEMVGGGGGGGGGAATAAGQVAAGGGGGGGAYSVGRFTSGFSGQTVTVGAAGTGSGLGGGGTAGTASSLGALITAPGGGGGVAAAAGAVSVAGGGVGGSGGTGGNIQQSTGAGAQPVLARFSDGAIAGGISVYTKFGGPSVAVVVNTAGNSTGSSAAATSYGVGGGGSASGAGQGGAVGGSGAPGIVIIYEYA